MQIQTNQFQREVKEHGDVSFPLLVSHEQLSRYETSSFLWHWHPELEFTIITKGAMEYQIQQKTFYAVEGSVVFCNANALHAGHMSGQQDCEYLSITLSPKLIYGFHASALEKKYVEPITKNLALAGLYFDLSCSWQKELRKLLEQIVMLYEERPPMFELDITTSVQRAWKLLYCHCRDVSNTDLRENVYQERILSMMHYIEQHYMEKISLSDFSDLLHISSGECSRMFSHAMNETLFSFIQEYRIERGVELLAQEELSITEIAQRVGFSDSNFFTKTFLKIKGCTPTAYRKRQ